MKQRDLAPWTDHMAHEVYEYYFRNYAVHFSSEAMCEAFATIPQVRHASCLSMPGRLERNFFRLNPWGIVLKLKNDNFLHSQKPSALRSLWGIGLKAGLCVTLSQGPHRLANISQQSAAA